MVEIRPSKGKGKGVFALKHIKNGERVTLYPAHAVFDIEGYEDGRARANLIFKHKDANVDTEMLRTYSVGIGDKMIYGDPNLIESFAVGHMINDGHRSKSERDADVYQICSALFANVTLDVPLYINNFPFVFMVATRDIKPDEEIFFSYGIEYWRHKW